MRANLSAALGACLACVLLPAQAQVQAPADASNFAIDPTHTFVNYENGHYGTTTNRGRFSTKDGTLFFDRAQRSGKVEIVIDITSVNTGVDFLNRQIQGKDFFNVADFPTGTFKSDQFIFNGDKVSEVHGQLTLKGQTHPVTLKATKFNCYINPLIKREVCGGDFETTIQRSQWGVLWGLQFGFEDAVKLLIQIEAIRMQ
jgi:polyisoprenoid-binding protein YceI